VGALGLMQLVPHTGAKDAYSKLTGKNKIPPNDYILNSNNNIQLGTLYISIIQNIYLNGVYDTNKLYLATSTSYNAGIGTLRKSFGSKQAMLAINNINSISVDELYSHLRNRLYFTKEATDYVQKVRERTLYWKKELDNGF
jgi:membrane-bound lytic murein transglycosylase C